MIRRLLCLVLLLLALPLQAAPTPTAADVQRFHSAILNEDRSYRVILPDSYSWASSRKYPVLYLLDGQTHAGHTAGSLGYLMQEGEIPELIIVSIDSTVRVRDFTQTDWPEAWIGGGGAEHFADFLQRELIPRIEHDFRTQPFRVLSGHSASGQFALHMLATRPALFNAFLVMAPSLDWDHGLPARELETELAKPGRPSPRFVYFAYADDFKDALDADLKLAKVVKAPGEKVVRVVVAAHPEERHGGIALLATIEGMRALYAGYQLPNDEAPPLAAVQAHYDALGARLGIAMPIPESALNDLAYRLLESKDVAQATTLFERAARENPDSSNAWDSLADAYAEAGQWQKALDAEKRALDLGKRLNTGDTKRYQHQVDKYQAKLATP
jgi:predicted alpha/beta superfamily hydrolase